MSGDLRTRIIAALLSEDDVALMADAVIAELNLRVAIVGDFQIALKGHYAREFPND